jgi:uncharacterized protein
MSKTTNSLDRILGAVYRKDFEVLKTLISENVDQTDDDGRTPLMHAILAEDVDPKIIRLLIAHGADINAFDSQQKWTALHFAARDQNEKIVQILLEAGAYVNPIDIFGNTPLWRSVMNSTSNLTVMQELIKYGANPYMKNNNGVAPIDVARNTGQADVITLFEGKICEY